MEGFYHSPADERIKDYLLESQMLADQEDPAGANKSQISAFDLMWETYAGEAKGFCAKRVPGGDERAEDLMQDIFKDWWLSLSSLRDVNGFRQSFWTIAHRRCSEVFRKKELPTISTVDDDGDVDEQVFGSTPDLALSVITQDEVSKMLEPLFERDQHILIASYRYDLPDEEIMRRLNFQTLEAVRTARGRALKRCRAALKKGRNHGN